MSDTTVGATPLTELPRDAAAAATMRAQLTSAPEYMKDWQTNQTKQAELGYLRWVAGGNDPDAWGKPPETPDDVRAGMADRDVAIDDARLATWENLIRMDDQMKFEHRRGLATAQQVEDAKADIERMKSDSAFRLRVLNGDQDAKQRWLRAGRVASMQVAPDDYKW
jgi:hypothetical protein